ncbi:MAG: preprotein translocase subunit SecE [Candidatus Wallacebacter cryptica]|nr:preprotein translocase subunit SecE [Bacillota bacterium]
MSAVTGKAKPSFWLRITKYFREVRSELRKVAWPNRKEVINNTGIVLLVVLIVAVFIGAVDFLISNLLSLLSRIGG